MGSLGNIGWLVNYIDGVDCFRDEHRPMNKDYFSHKFHHAGLSYLIACSLGPKRKIIWWGGGVPCGKNPDLNIAREKFVSKLEHKERCLADKGFMDDRYFKTPFARSTTQFTAVFNQQHKKKWPVMKISTSASSSLPF